MRTPKKKRRGQEPDILIRSEKSDVYSRFAHKYACMCTCVYTADTYDSRSDRSDHIYHEIEVENHSSANSGQEPDFLIRRAAKKVTFIGRKQENLYLAKYTYYKLMVFTIQ